MARNNNQEWQDTCDAVQKEKSISITLPNDQPITWRNLCEHFGDLEEKGSSFDGICQLAEVFPSLFPNDNNGRSEASVDITQLLQAVTDRAVNLSAEYKLTGVQRQHHRFFIKNQEVWIVSFQSLAALNKNKSQLEQLPSQYFGEGRLHPSITDNVSFYQSLLTAFFAYLFAQGHLEMLTQVQHFGRWAERPIFLKIVRSKQASARKKCLYILHDCQKYIEQSKIQSSLNTANFELEEKATNKPAKPSKVSHDEGDSTDDSTISSTSAGETSSESDRETPSPTEQPLTYQSFNAHTKHPHFKPTRFSSYDKSHIKKIQLYKRQISQTKKHKIKVLTELKSHVEIKTVLATATLEDNHPDYQSFAKCFPHRNPFIKPIKSKNTRNRCDIESTIKRRLIKIQRYLDNRNQQNTWHGLYYSKQDYKKRQRSFNEIIDLLENETITVNEKIKLIRKYHIPKFSGKNMGSRHRYQDHLHKLIIELNEAVWSHMTPQQIAEITQRAQSYTKPPTETAIMTTSLATAAIFEPLEQKSEHTYSRDQLKKRSTTPHLQKPTQRLKKIFQQLIDLSKSQHSNQPSYCCFFKKNQLNDISVSIQHLIRLMTATSSHELSYEVREQIERFKHNLPYQQQLKALQATLDQHPFSRADLNRMAMTIAKWRPEFRPFQYTQSLTRPNDAQLIRNDDVSHYPLTEAHMRRSEATDQYICNRL